MGKIQSIIGLADVEPSPRSEETSFSSSPFSYSTAAVTIWEAIDFDNAYGTVLIIGDSVAGTTKILINGANTTIIANSQTIARTINPLTSVTLAYSSAGTTSTLSVSITANRFVY